MKRTWTPQMEKRLDQYAKRGFSQTEAAKCLGVTRGAVAQKASQLKIRFHGPEGAPPFNRNAARPHNYSH